jgi:hypothetical protein
VVLMATGFMLSSQYQSINSRCALKDTHEFSRSQHEQLAG